MPPTTNTSKETSSMKIKVVRRVVTTKTTHRTLASEESSALPVFVLVAILTVLLAAYASTPSILLYMNRTESYPIRVWDDVLNEQACDRLHQTSSQLVGKEKAMLFQWPNHDYHNDMERVISSILSEMYTLDETFVVEYWVRQQWHHTIAHADCDEDILKEHSVLRHPIQGHVLYLKKGTDVNGPTVVFGNVTRGGEMYSEARDQEMLIVPFHPGRLLQFDGKLLHAVPRPANLWIHPVMEELEHDPPSQYGRSVVLFNLWKEPPGGLEFSSQNEADQVDSTTTSDANKHDSSLPLCNNKSQWKRADIVNDWQESLWNVLVKSKQRFQLPLMGSATRRGTSDVTLDLKATDLVEEALEMSELDVRPKRVYLTVPNEKKMIESNANDL